MGGGSVRAVLTTDKRRGGEGVSDAGFTSQLMVEHLFTLTPIGDPPLLLVRYY